MSVTRPQQAVRAPAAFGRLRLQHPRVIAAAGVLGLSLLAAVLAGMWAGRHAAPAESPPPDQVRQVSAGHGRLTVPSTWRPATLSATGLPGLTPAKSAALSVRTDVPAWAVAMITPADHPSLVTHPLRRLLQGPLPPPRETRLGGRVAWLYTGLTTRAGRALEMTVQPTTAGVLAVACVSPASARPPEALCGGAVTAAAVSGATTLVPGPSVALALGLEPRLRALDGTRMKMRASLSRAESPGAQARLARRLAGAHLGEAEALAPLAATAGASLVHALRKVGSAYADLATAAADGSRAAFSAARQDIDAAESRLADAVGSVSRRIAPKPAPPLPRAASPPPSGPSSLLLLLAVVSLAAALALVHGPRVRDQRKGARVGFARLAPARPSRLEPAPRPGRLWRPGRAPLAAPRVEAPARRGTPPARPRPTPSARRGVPVTKPPAQPAAAQRPDTSARRAKRPAPASAASSAAPAAPRQKPPPEPAAVPTAPSSVEPSAASIAQNGDGGAGTPAVAAPARSATGCTCEIVWHASLRVAAFRATAARPGGDPQEIARSSPVQWPPVIPPEPTPEIEEALLALEERLVASGWTPIEQCRPEWYRRRFAWTEAEPPRPPPAAPGLNSGWTCEIVWRAGLRGAGFHAHARTASGERKHLVVARSPKLEWPPLLPPSPNDELVAAADGVECALIASGWKPAGRGTAWYARRFAWTSDAPPVAR